MKRVRLDTLVVDRGLVASRERARATILAGRVRVDGALVSKAGALVAPEAQIHLVAPDHPYVSRGGIKLAHALDTFGIAVSGRHALDIGASTGGFTDVLLKRGARTVIALDVGHGQLDWTLRQDPRVTVLERVNARWLSPADLPRKVDLVTADVSFISLRQILPAIPPLVEAPADIVVLVKPQFEAGRDAVGKKGLVRDPAVHDAVVAAVSETAVAVGLVSAGMTPSPIAGAEGNREFFLHLRAREGAAQNSERVQEAKSSGLLPKPKA